MQQSKRSANQGTVAGGPHAFFYGAVRTLRTRDMHLMRMIA